MMTDLKRSTKQTAPGRTASAKRLSRDKIRRVFFGGHEPGLIYKFVVFVLLLTLGFIFLYPLINMLSYSFMTQSDLLNPLVSWIPTQLYLGNYERAYLVMDYLPALQVSLYVALLPSVVQTASSAIIGYGFANFKFPGRRIWFALVIATFLVPSQVTTIPQFLTYRQLGILDTILAYVLPALFGQGLRSAIFILIFYSFFNLAPKSLEEAAQVDGAGPLMVFLRIALPSAGPAFIISFLFSFVWYWNETYLATMYFGENIRTLPMRLEQFVAAFSRMYGQQGPQGQTSNEAIEMAGTFLIILPLLVLYFITQRWFVESISRTGITGE